MGRRRSLCLCFFILSASCIIAMLCKHFSGCIPDVNDCGIIEIPQNCNAAMLNASKYLAFVGKFAVGSCFSILYTYSAELYPTCVRSSAVGFCSSMARVGGALSPLIFGIDATIPWFSNTVFGALSFIGEWSRKCSIGFQLTRYQCSTFTICFSNNNILVYTGNPRQAFVADYGRSWKWIFKQLENKQNRNRAERKWGIFRTLNRSFYVFKCFRYMDFYEPEIRTFGPHLKLFH